jgi:hypothetical protein
MERRGSHDWSKLHLDVISGCANGKIIWQPRIGAWWWEKIFFKKPFPPGYSDDLHELYRQLDASARLYEYTSCFRRIEDPRVRCYEREINDTNTEHIIETPVGKQTYITRKTPNNWEPVVLKREVSDEEELKVATWREEHVSWKWDQERFDETQRKCGDLGAPTINLPRSNVQCLYIEKMGVENAVYALYDYPDTVEKFFIAREESSNRLIELVKISPIKIINFGENIHAGILSPDLFLKYHLPECQRRCDALHRVGKFCSSHWDGDTKPLLKYVKETGLDGIEAITPKPQGDVTLEDVKEALGDEIFLLDGIPAVYFDNTFSEQTLIDCTKKIIDMFAPKLVLGISDEISSTGDIERIRTVGKLVDDYNARQ